MSYGTYPQMIRVFRPKQTAPAAGAQSASGKWTPDPLVTQQTDVLYDGPGDYQDTTQKLQREADATPSQLATGVIFFPIEDVVFDMRTDDSVEITWPTGRTEQANITDVRRIDGSVLVIRVTEQP